MQKRKIKVFLADDHPVVAMGISQLLANHPTFEFIGHTSNAVSLFDQLGKINPDILLLDLNIPGSDFYSNLERLKKEFSRLKVIAFTGYYAHDLEKSVIEKGALGFLEKGANAEEILDALDSVANGRKFIKVKSKKLVLKDQLPGPSGLPPDDFQKRLRLSKREREILVLISRGLTSQNIGDTLFISRHTVETHRKNILRKLELSSSTELVKFAIHQGLV